MEDFIPPSKVMCHRPSDELQRIGSIPLFLHSFSPKINSAQDDF